MDQISFLEKSLRLRYEVFSKFAAEISKVESIEAAGQTIAANLKFILDAFIFRFTFIYQHNLLTYELFSGNHTWQSNQVDALTSYELECQRHEIPLELAQEDIRNDNTLKESIFAHDKVTHLFVLPLRFASDQHLVLMIASKNAANYNEVDFRFVKLIGELLGTKISQLLLITKIASKNEELEIAYTEIKERNQEIEAQQEALVAQALELQSAYAEIKKLNAGLEKIVEERTKKLTEAHQELNTLFYRTSHDFRRPLTSIVGLTNIAAYSTQDTQTLELFSHIKKSAEELDKMLAKLQIMSFAEVEVSETKEVAFSEILEGLREKFNPILQEKQVDFQYNLQHAFCTDPYMVTAILENLIENAIFFCAKSQAFVQVDIFEHDSNLCIRATDNGQGIKEELQSRIFEMYFRANEGSSGNGLGLYVVRKLVEKLQGKIRFRSMYGKGSVFEIHLPLQKKA